MTPAATWRRARTLPSRLPLRVTLVAAVLALVAVALIVTGFTATAVMRGYLIDRVDQNLQVAAHGELDRLNAGFAIHPRPDGGPNVPNQLFFAVTDPSGTVLGELSPDLAANDSPRLPALTAAAVEARDGNPYTVGSTDAGPDWRLVTVGIPGTTASLTVGQSLGDVQATVGRLDRVEIAVGLAVLVALAGVAYTVVRSSLRPLREVEATAAAIAGGDLSHRAPERDPRTEAGRLGAAFNAMLSRVESAFRAQEASERAARASEQRMRRFVADASHELRTPLTSIRGFAELFRQGAARDEAQLGRAMRRIEDEAARMGLLVDDLLLLARLDERRPLQRAPVDLLSVAGDAVHDAQVREPQRPVSLVVLPDEDGRAPLVIGDDARLRQVTANLVTNALTHTPPGTPVTVRVGVSGEAAVLEVADEGPGLTPEQQQRVFERFYRVEESRTRSSGGSGLGLAIVAALVAAHDGRVSVHSEPGHGASFRVELPLAPPGQAAEAQRERLSAE